MSPWDAGQSQGGARSQSRAGVTNGKPSRLGDSLCGDPHPLSLSFLVH